MEYLSNIWNYGIIFLILLTILVFVHEMGHYLVARWNGVRVEVFSVGFGPELIGWTDKHDTRWKISLIPLGGYVKMFGETEIMADTDDGPARPLTPDEEAVSFHHKRLGQRTAIVAAGPLANFLFAIVIYALMFSIFGQPYTSAEVQTVVPDSAAEAAGILPGDTFVRIDGATIERFEDVQQIVGLNPEIALTVVVLRDGREIELIATPSLVEREDRFGNKHKIGQLGVTGTPRQIVQRDPLSALWQGARETVQVSIGTLQAVGQMIMGRRSAEELGGPLRIAKMAGDVSQVDPVWLIQLMALISVNLGLINLFPIPILDGGHLLFYMAEAVRGKPLGPRAQEYGVRIGLALVLSLMVFATFNDLVHLRVLDF